ncbi:Calmodulin-lysine N-methyltransferase [Daphnia magna]|nr:Calmodulin-lysine N-methyltransferase [Daphnia magna]
MTCLASFAVAKTSDAMLVACTDGNPASVENVKRIIEHNNLSSTCPITAQVLDWKNESSFKEMESMWDVILCADCLFFDDGREALVDTMRRITTRNGLILIMAPRRGRTLDAFLELCHDKFDIYLNEEFDSDVTRSHQKKLLSPDYNSDHNYPLLVQLKKR